MSAEEKYFLTRVDGETLISTTRGEGTYWRTVMFEEGMTEDQAQVICDALNFEHNLAKSNKEYLHSLTVGDWSNDGHGKIERFVIKSNYNKKIIQDSYIETCRELGLQLGRNDKFMGENERYRDDWRHLLIDYEDCNIDERAFDILLNVGYDFREHDIYLEDGEVPICDDIRFNPDDVMRLFMFFVEYSAPKDFTWSEEMGKSDELVGYYGRLNSGIGYGVFD